MKYLFLLLLTACTNLPVADTGLALDGGITAAGIASGRLVEANPVRPDGALGNLAFSAGVIGVRHLVKNYANDYCVPVTRAMSTAGWAGTGNGIVQLAGAGTVIGLPVAIVAGIIAFRRDYKSECVK